MKLKGVIDEDFLNYKKIAMTLEFPYCSFKCDKECGQQVCQNSELAAAPNIEVDIDDLIVSYLHNPLTDAVVCQGLEPFDSWEDLYKFIDTFRKSCKHDIVIYTGYTKKELENMGAYIFEYAYDHKNHPLTRLPIKHGSPLTILKNYDNIIIKYGRYIPNQPSRYDSVLDVTLASDNQYAERIS